MHLRGSSLAVRNFLRIKLRGEKRRKSCQVSRKASVTTHSEGGAWVFMVRRKDEKLCQTEQRKVSARYCNNP